MHNPERWRPQAALSTLRLRASFLVFVRDFFRERGFWEVETPLLGRAGAADAQLAQFTLTDPVHGPLYLQTSPEYAMKRLLAAGSGSIFQISKAFRQGEVGSRHNPEFTLIEWYGVGYDHTRLINETCCLIGELLPHLRTDPSIMSFGDAFLRAIELDPMRAPTEALRDAVRAHLPSANALTLTDRDEVLDLLMSEVVSARFPTDRLTVITDYPKTQAALARINAQDLADRFEIYCGGLELANGFYEAAGYEDYARRFEEEARKRHERFLPPIARDDQLLAALAHAPLPDCAGVALGFDRVVMLALNSPHLSDTLAFPINRA